MFKFYSKFIYTRFKQDTNKLIKHHKQETIIVFYSTTLDHVKLSCTLFQYQQKLSFSYNLSLSAHSTILATYTHSNPLPPISTSKHTIISIWVLFLDHLHSPVAWPHRPMTMTAVESTSRFAPRMAMATPPPS